MPMNQPVVATEVRSSTYGPSGEIEENENLKTGKISRPLDVLNHYQVKITKLFFKK